METISEEMIFKDHRMSELVEALNKEKEQCAALEEEVQGLLENLASEVEKYTALSSELQVNSQEKEVYIFYMLYMQIIYT